jgi:hypothetical protein
MLISYGSETIDAVLQAQFSDVMSNAVEYNDKADPATCSGGHEPMPLLDRLKLAFWG